MKFYRYIILIMVLLFIGLLTPVAMGRESAEANKSEVVQTRPQAAQQVVYLSPTKDAYGESGYPTIATGNHFNIYLGYDTWYSKYRTRPWIQFNLSSIPAGATIDSARLEMYQYAVETTSSYSVVAYPINQSWNEYTLTWSNHPSKGSLVGSATFSPNLGWQYIDLTTLTRNWYSGATTNYGVTLRRGTNEYYKGGIFYSRNCSSSQCPGGQRPRLKVVYTPPVTYSVSGQATDNNGIPIAGVSVSDGSTTVTTDSNGNYTISGLSGGSYTLTPDKGQYTFSPVTRTINLSSNVTGQDFSMIMGCEDRSAVDVILTLDKSGSMTGQPLTDAKNNSKYFIDLLNLSVDQVGLVSFNSSAYLNSSSQLTSNGNSIKTEIDSLSAGGGTNIAGAIYKAGYELESNRHQINNKSVIVLLSDGEQTVNTDGQPIPAADWAKSKGIRIMTIGLGVTPGSEHESTLITMASSSSDYYYAPTSTDLHDVYEKIATKVGCSGGSVYLPIIIANNGASLGQVTGNMGYPSSNIPPMTAYFKNTQTNAITSLPIAPDQFSYQISLPAGVYIAYAWYGNFGGLYSYAVPCGLTINCNDHRPFPFTVVSGQTTSGVNIYDWYSQPDVPLPPGQ